MKWNEYSPQALVILLSTRIHASLHVGKAKVEISVQAVSLSSPWYTHIPPYMRRKHMTAKTHALAGHSFSAAAANPAALAAMMRRYFASILDV